MGGKVSSKKDGIQKKKSRYHQGKVNQSSWFYITPATTVQAPGAETGGRGWGKQDSPAGPGMVGRGHQRCLQGTAEVPKESDKTPERG